MKGQLRLLILRLLAESDKRSGSSLAQTIEDRVGNHPSPGTLYPMLDRMDDDGLIEKEQVGRKNKYSITENGKKSVRSFAQENEEHMEDIIRSMKQHKEIFGQKELAVHIDRMKRLKDGDFPATEIESLLHDVDIAIQSGELDNETKDEIKTKLRTIKDILTE